MLAVALAPTLALAESPDRADPFGPDLRWQPIVEVRGRLETTGSPIPDSRTVGQVARVGIEADRGILSARVSLQEVRAWTGDEAGLTVAGSFAPELAEGWARLDGQLSGSLGGRLTIGRQPIAIDDGRIVGQRAWDLDGQFLDAIRFELMAAPLSFDVINARRFDADPTTNADPFGAGVTIVRAGVARPGPNVDGKLDLLSVVDARKTAALTSTTGLYGTLSTGRTLGTGEAYVQKNTDGDASLVSLELGYVLGRRRAWVTRIRYTTATGAPGESGAAAFQPVLGDTHDQYGLLDLVEPGDDLGLNDVAVTGELQAGARVTLRGEVHRLGSPVDGSAFGYETDLGMAWHITPYAETDLGIGQLSGGSLGAHVGAHAQIAVAF